MSEAKSPEVRETKQPQIENYKEIKPETNMSVNETKDYWDNTFNNELSDVHEGEFYNSHENRIKCTPTETSESGNWEGERGEAKFIPSRETEAGQAAIDKLAEKGLDGIEYKNAEPDFSKCSEATVQIDNMTESRYNNYVDPEGNVQKSNFSQADEKCAEQWNSTGKDGKEDWVARDVANWRQENKCSWHERSDTKTMDMVSQDIHGYFKHPGGVSECKIRDAKALGGEFDE
jgi:hypothetical protein